MPSNNSLAQKGGDYMLQDMLFKRIQDEETRLNKSGDVLLSLCAKYREDSLDFYKSVEVAALTVQYDDLADSISNLYVAMLECGDNRTLLLETIPFLNHLSFSIACYIAKVHEIKEDVFK